MEKQLEYLNYKNNRFYKENIKELDFVLKTQLKNTELWNKFISVFQTKEDSEDLGWRGEYFGKMMRGACMVFSLVGDTELYSILTDCIEKMLAQQDEFGRISSYDVANEFTGWDVWCRKYVLVGFEYFYGICSDAALKNRVLLSLKKQADYIISKIGVNGKNILETSDAYGGVNSSTILEPILKLYSLTGDKKYINFTKYIIEQGGCKFGNLIEYAQTRYPDEYPETKAYETISFFEGVFDFGIATKNKFYINTAKKFADDLYLREITVVGGIGCHCEVFNNAALTQTEESGFLMQETCVSVTWLRFISKLYSYFKDIKYQDWIEKTYLNVMRGSVNTEGYRFFSVERNEFVAPLAFDSYSPITSDVRGRAISGYKEFKSGGFYSCCSAIGAAGIAAFYLNAFIKEGRDFIVNQYIGGEYSFSAANGKTVNVILKTHYPFNGKIHIEVLSDTNDFRIKFRIPEWCSEAYLKTQNGIIKCEKGYFIAEGGLLTAGESVLDFSMPVVKIELNGKYAYRKGPCVLAQSEDMSDRKKFKFGSEVLDLCEYSFCGKKNLSVMPKINVWFKDV